MRTTNTINAGAKGARVFMRHNNQHHHIWRKTKTRERKIQQQQNYKRTLIHIIYKVKCGAHCLMPESLCVCCFVYGKHAVNDTRLTFTPGIKCLAHLLQCAHLPSIHPAMFVLHSRHSHECGVVKIRGELTLVAFSSRFFSSILCFIHH